MNKTMITRSIALTITALALSSAPLAYAQLSNSNATQVNINQGPTNNTSIPVMGSNINVPVSNGNSPFGGFSLVKCDGPDISGLGANTQMTVTIGGVPHTGTPAQLKDAGYTPCDFQGLMIQAQFLINVLIVFGVLAAIIIAVYAGFLYISGSQENIKKAKSIFPKLAWGFILMLTAWFIVYQILVWLTGNAGFLSGNGSH